MQFAADILQDAISELQSLGALKIESSNVILYRRLEDERLLLAIASRSSHLTVESTLTIPTDDPFFFNGALSVDFNAFHSIIGGMKGKRVEMVMNTDNPSYIKISSPQETFDIVFYSVGKTDISEIFYADSSEATMFIESEMVANLSPLTIMVQNIALLCTDNQFKTILYRRGKEMRAVFITNTTLNSFSCTLHSGSTEYEAEGDVGIETKTSFIPKALSQILSYLKDRDLLTIKYDDNSMYFETRNAKMRTVYESKNKNISHSITQYHNMRDIIENLNSNMLTIKAPATDILTLIRKSSLLISKSKMNKLTSYVPMYVVDDSTLRVDFRNTNGSYRSDLTTNIQVEGLPEGYETCKALLNMSVPMMTSILTTLTKVFGDSRCVIEMRQSDNNKIYIKIYNERTQKIEYYMRLRM